MALSRSKPHLASLAVIAMVAPALSFGFITYHEMRGFWSALVRKEREPWLEDDHYSHHFYSNIDVENYIHPRPRFQYP